MQMQLRDVNYYSDVLISIDIYAQSHSKRALEGGGGRCRTMYSNQLPHKQRWTQQVGGSYSWWAHTTGLEQLNGGHGM